MSNPLPPGVIPKLFRQRNKEGKEVGNWYIKIKKKAVNLRTQAYSKARDRARDAWDMGVREFQDDRFFEAAAPPSPIASPNVATASNEWSAEVAAAAASGLQPDAYFDKEGKSTPLLTSIPMPDDSGRPPSGKVEDEAPKAEGGESTSIPPEMFQDLMKFTATMAVELQLQGQEWLIARALKSKAGPVPMNHIGRVAGIQFWEKQLAQWVPKDVPLPEWAAAMIAVAALGGMCQLQGATPIVKEDVPSSPPSYPTTE